MRYKGFLALILACALLFSSGYVLAGTGKTVGTVGATELLIPVGARSTALSGANMAQVSGIDAMYWNPAGLANGRATEAIFSYQNWIGDINVSYLGLATQLGALGSLGISVKTLNFGDIVETTVTAPEGTGSTFSPNYLTVGATFSRKMTDRILFGATAKLVSEKIMGTGASGIGFDFGLQYNSPVSGIKLGIVMTNFGGNMKFDGANLERRTVLPGTEAGTVQTNVSIPTASFGLPSQLKIGVSYNLGMGEDMAMQLMGTFVNNSFAFDQYILGSEVTFKDVVYLRGSYSLAYKEGITGESNGFVSASEDFLFGPSFGLGLVLNVGVPLHVDYAYQLTEFFDNNQQFSVSFGF